jgi:hypothetical protein
VEWINAGINRLGGRIEQVDAALYIRQDGGEEVTMKSYSPRGIAIYAPTLQGLGAGTTITTGREKLERWNERFHQVGLTLKIYVGGKLLATLGAKKSKLNLFNALYIHLFKRK